MPGLVAQAMVAPEGVLTRVSDCRPNAPPPWRPPVPSQAWLEHFNACAILGR